MWCTRLDRDGKETSQMKTITKKAGKAPKATTKTSDPILTGAEPELGNAQGITINDSREVIKPAEEARQEQMKTDLTKLKAGDKKRKAAVKAAKKATANPAAKNAAKPAKAAAKPAKAVKKARAAKASRRLRAPAKKTRSSL